MNKTKLQIIFYFIFISYIYGDLADPRPFMISQPNGIEFEVLNKGNHLQGWLEFNGWTIVKNSENWWVYAQSNDGRVLKPSGTLVGIDSPPSDFNQVIKKGIRPDAIVLEDNSPVPDLNSTRTDTFHVPLILVEFPDNSATYDSSEFDLLMNQEGYTHLNYENTGSFRDYYQEISHDQFLPISRVTNWIIAPNNHSHYSYSNPDGYSHVRELVRYLVDELEDQGFDWSKFDNDGDGYVDALNVLHQGAGAEQGDHSNIWSHKWSLGGLSVTYDGVIIDSYTMNPETQSGNIVAIGVLAHEFGHALGLPDLYDTDYTSTGSGAFSLMAGGTWGTTGNSPWHPSTMIGWCKNQLGWVEVVNIDENQNNVEIEQSYSSNQIIRVNHPLVTEEYWLIENRQKIGSDTLLPEPGLAIWHINDDIAQGWAINNNEPYYGVGLEQADGMFALENGGPSNAADMFPGLSNNREFSNSTSPDTKSLYGEPSMMSLDNISDPNPIMTFNVTYNEIILASASIEDGTGLAFNQGNIFLGMENEMEISELTFELSFSPSYVEITSIIPTERTVFDSAIIENNLVTLINPYISNGSGPILEVIMFNNVGVETEVIVNFDMCVGFTPNGQEIGINILDEANYHIQPSTQFFNIQNGSGSINGGASCTVSLVNTVPIAMTVFQIIPTPNLLIPSDEPFEDLNGNGFYDINEPFIDWNNNSQWSPIIEPIDLDDNWSFELSLHETFITVGITNWDQALEVGPHNLFQINYVVAEEAQLDDIINLSTDVVLILDAWGNNGIPFVNGSGTVSIDNVLSSVESNLAPETFSLNNVYPNPFNAQTTFEFSVPLEDDNIVSIKIFDLKGQLAEQIFEKSLSKGIHRYDWDANNHSTGIYFVEFKSGEITQIKKITLLK
jgi:immune inhibitor A